MYADMDANKHMDMDADGYTDGHADVDAGRHDVVGMSMWMRIL